MILTPFVIIFSENISVAILNIKIWNVLNNKSKKTDPHTSVLEEEISNHLIIIGYGINGSNLAKAARYSNIPYVVIELNAQLVKNTKAKKIPILYGDATQDHILEKVHLAKARAVVIAISDPAATRAIITNIRSVSQSVYLLVRTRYVRETNELLALGADDVIPEEFETSIQIFSRVLHNFLVPEDDIEHFVDSIRLDNYDLFKTQKKLPTTMRTTKLPDFHITCLRINSDSGKLVGKSLKDTNVRAVYGVNILAISRDDTMIYDIQPDEKLKQHDLLYINGPQENIEKFHRLIA
jgi:CPA2 family monovalent cation:H+ antiporter-2